MTSPHPDRFKIEQLSAGELADDDRKSLRGHLETCDACRSYFEELEADQKALMVTNPPTAFAAKVLERAERNESLIGVRRRLWLGLGLAAATAVVLAFLFWPQSSPRDDDRGGFRLMGSVTTRAFLRRDAKVGLLPDDSELRPGDALRLEVTSAGRAWATLLAVMNGEDEPVTISPEEGSALQLVGQTMLPGSVEVTADPEPVLLLLIVRDARFTTADIAREAHEARRGRHVESWRGEGLEGVAWSRLIDVGNGSGDGRE